jgi:hypothetical protein
MAGIVKPVLIVCALVSASLVCGAEFPEAKLTNGPLKATVLLPDAKRGYYRGTRFDWSGNIESLEYNGHNYFGKWFEKYDPKIHDAIMGPVEEFRTGDSALGYDAAKPGETFVKIGVGVLRKPDEPAYKFATPYEIVNGGKWSSKSSANEVRFKHELRDASGYAYVYQKIVRLVPGQPQMVIEHHLKNTGKKTIETSVYDHNFFVIDGQPSGPDFRVAFPFAVQTVADVANTVVAKGNQFTYVRELPPGESVFTELKGYGSTSKDYDINVENTKEKVGAHITGDQPLSKLLFWSIRSTLCPEAYVSMTIEPGKTSEWKITYNFY